MWSILARFMEWSVKGSVKTALTGAGLGLASATISLTYMQQYLNELMAVGNSLMGDSLALLALSGGDLAFSMIIGALVTRTTISASKISLVRMQR
ncbi:DUF2523 family protein [Acinetobacter indicus]|uniref:DUF2523 family protein n=1 Tax=Acinetobacter indicus TaxID=756892 RepID=UPI0032159F2D